MLSLLWTLLCIVVVLIVVVIAVKVFLFLLPFLSRVFIANATDVR